MIKKLPSQVIDKLKAGEIVERPASVVKELIENSIDAGCNNISIEILEGGKNLIKIFDDGIGITKQDLSLTIERYATSKISNYEDLEKISTYGFRGEALAAISEVSEFKIISKTADENVAWQLEKIGKNVKILPSGINFKHGTIVYVQNLFYNIPVRRKYLKSKKTELYYIKNLIINYALINENIGIKLISDGKKIYDFSCVPSLENRILDIFGENIFQNLIYFENSKNDFKIYGFVGNSQLSFQNTDNIYLFVNKRPINDKILKKAIIQAYYRQIPLGEYPFTILYLDINPYLIDVNVHPRKLEIKFKYPNTIYNFVYDTIIDSLGNKKISSGFFSDKYETVDKDNFLTTQKIKKEKDNLHLQFNYDNKSLIYNDNISQDLEIDTMNTKFNFKIIGQLWNTYILLEDEDNLYIVDHHALAERIIFEKIKKDIKKFGSKPTPLLSPLTLELPLHFIDSEVEKKIEKLNELGFDIGLIGNRKITIWSVPSVFNKYKIEISKLVINILEESEININIDKLLDNILATKACKTAIKAGDKLSLEEIKKLIENGFEYINGQFVCQHGRPSFVKISKKQINKLFDR